MQFAILLTFLLLVVCQMSEERLSINLFSKACVSRTLLNSFGLHSFCGMFLPMSSHLLILSSAMSSQGFLLCFQFLFLL